MTAGSGARNKLVGLICVGHFYSHFSGLILPPLFPLLAREFGVSYVELAYTVAAYSATSSIGQIPIGFLVDRIGARAVLLWGLAILGASFALVGVVDSFWMVVALSGIAGFGNSVFHPADYAILSARVHERVLGRAMGIHSFSGYVGWAVAALAMPITAELLGWREAVVIAGIVGLAIALLLWVNGAVLTYDARGAGEDKARSRVSPLQQGLALMRSRTMAMLFLFFLLTSASITGAGAFAVAAVHELYNVSLQQAGYALTCFMVAMAAGVLVGGVLADHTPRHNLVTSVSLAAASAFIAFVGLGHMPFWLVLAVLAASGLCFGITSPSRDLLVRAATPPGSIGVAFGYTSTGLGVGNFVGPLAIGVIMDAHYPGMAFVALGAVSAVAIVTVVLTTSAGTPDRG